MTIVGKETYNSINDKEGEITSNPLGKITANVFIFIPRVFSTFAYLCAQFWRGHMIRFHPS